MSALPRDRRREDLARGGRQRGQHGLPSSLPAAVVWTLVAWGLVELAIFVGALVYRQA